MSKLNYKTILPLLRVCGDILLIPLIFILAYSIKFKIGWISQKIFSLNYGQIYQHAQIEPYLKFLGIITILWLIAFYFAGMYKNFTGLMPEIDEFLAIFKGITISAIETAALTIIFTDFPASKSVILYAWLLGLVFYSIHRFIFKKIEIHFIKKDNSLEKVLIIGANHFGQDIAEKIILCPTYKMKYIGTLDLSTPKNLHFHLQKKFNYLGSLNDYKKIIQQKHINTIFLTIPDQNPKFTEELTLYCVQHNVKLKIITGLSQILQITIQIENFDGLTFNSISLARKTNFNQFLKRCLDISGSLFLLVLLLPLFVLIATIIKITSPFGPIFYFQKRITLNHKTFQMIKFRTMIPDAETSTGPVFTKKNKENRYIKCGHFLRSSSLDELPQLFNILKGELSLVGPRPERPYFIQKFNQQSPYYNLRHVVKGGLTGLAQINGRDYLTHKPMHKLKYDLYYIKNWSLLLDIKIILKTILIVFTKEEAY